MSEWSVQILSEREERPGHWAGEISVIHESDEHGKVSHGWFGPTKWLILSTGGLGSHETYYTEVWMAAKAKAHDICKRLNSGTINDSQRQRIVK